jgi:tetratricopeptide (TPR) repeat protein
MARGNLGDANNQIGRYAEAEALLLDAHASAERMGLSNVAAMARVNRGWSLAHLDRIDDALALARKGALDLGAQGDVRREGGAWIYIALMELSRGALGEATRSIDRALDIVRGTPPTRAWALAVKAEILRNEQRFLEARELAREALDMLGQMGFLDEGESIVRLAWAEALRATGDEQGFRAAIEDAKASLARRAAAIEDASRRESFLENVPENARTLALAVTP